MVMGGHKETIREVLETNKEITKEDMQGNRGITKEDTEDLKETTKETGILQTKVTPREETNKVMAKEIKEEDKTIHPTITVKRSSMGIRMDNDPEEERRTTSTAMKMRMEPSRWDPELQQLLYKETTSRPFSKESLPPTSRGVEEGIRTHMFRTHKISNNVKNTMMNSHSNSAEETHR
jgi:hypothetical protein